MPPLQVAHDFASGPVDEMHKRTGQTLHRIVAVLILRGWLVRNGVLDPRSIRRN